MRELGLFLGLFFWFYVSLTLFRMFWSIVIQRKSFYKVCKAVGNSGLFYEVDND